MALDFKNYRDVLIDNLIDDAMERDDQDNIHMMQREKHEWGKYLRKLAEISRCWVTFNVWKKKNADGKASGIVDSTSLMGD